MATREQDLVETLISLADTLVADYDVVDFMHTLVERAAVILNAVDAAILLPAPSGVLEVVAATSEHSGVVSMMQVRADEGPSIDAYRAGKVVSVDRIADTYARWPVLVTQEEAVGFQAMHAIPLRLRHETIGTFSLFSDGPGALNPADVLAAQGLADIATIGILQARSIDDANTARDQLQHALDSRVLIEQAKGVLTRTENVSIDEAFRLLRDRARRSGRRLSDVAREVVDAGQNALTR